MTYKSFDAYTDQEILDIVKKVYSISGLLREIGLKAAGGNYDTAKKVLNRLKADTDHWTGQGWTKDKQLKNIENYTRPTQIKKHLIVERDHKCECCQLDTWLEQPIMLELEHSDGNKYNNDRANLKLLCPNCHAQTKTWRGRKNLFTARNVKISDW